MLKTESLKNGEEQYERYHSAVINQYLVQYDYRDYDGELFSTVAKSLNEAREKKDKWLSIKKK